MAEFDSMDDGDRARWIEERLHNLLSRQPYARDDRRLARVYLAIANLLRPRMNDELTRCLDFLNSADRKDESVLLNWSRHLSMRGFELQNDPTRPHDKFLYSLMESCAKPEFTIFPDNDVEPIGWAVLIGVSFDDVLRVVAREYPEITNP